MVSTYNYSLFLRNKKGDLPQKLPSPPDALKIRVQPEKREGEVISWLILLPMGLSREQLVDLLEWLSLVVEEQGGGTLYDPQLGQPLDLDRDDEHLIHSVERHDRWILENLGGESVSSPDTYAPLLPTRTKVILWFGAGVVLLYFLTHLLLNSYFH